MKRILRHTSISPKPEVAAIQLGENARDANEIFLQKLDGFVVAVKRYAAIGSTSARLNLANPEFRPSAVVLVRAFPSNAPSEALGAVSGCNFYHDHLGVGVYEPSGLTANTLYDLTFLVLE